VDDGAERDLVLLDEKARCLEADDEILARDDFRRALADTGAAIPVTGPRKPVYGIMGRNVQQTMALELLLDDDVKIVTLTGPAGTGKTLLAIAAGLHKTIKEERFDKLLTARPIMPLGRDIGYLPGDKDEKLSMWMQPIFDNITYLLSTRGSHVDERPESRTAEQRLDQLMATGRVVMEPLTYLRGRSIPHQVMIVDEAQKETELKRETSRKLKEEIIDNDRLTVANLNRIKNLEIEIEETRKLCEKLDDENEELREELGKSLKDEGASAALEREVEMLRELLSEREQQVRSLSLRLADASSGSGAGSGGFGSSSGFNSSSSGRRESILDRLGLNKGPTAI
jgi:hypothetical protein